MSSHDVTDEQPRKKQRLTGPEDEKPATTSYNAVAETAPAQPGVQKDSEGEEHDESIDAEFVVRAQVEAEARAGITAYATEAPGFSGILKKRYTDFLVNEILNNGRVLHLEDMGNPKPREKSQKKQSEQVTDRLGDVKPAEEEAAQPTQSEALPAEVPEDTPKAPAENAPTAAEQKTETEEKKAAALASISEADMATLKSIFGEKTTQDLLNLFAKVMARPDRKARDFPNFVSEPILDKQKRTDAHISVRRIFRGCIDTQTDAENSIAIKAAPPGVKAPVNARQMPKGGNRPKGKVGWEELGGEYLHFSLYKENKDTMEVLYFIASSLKLHVKNLSFAGTKDRRGVTVQRVSAYRLADERLRNLNRQFRASRLGGFKYEKTNLELGDLRGNEFVITLRDCTFPGSPSDPSLRFLHAQGIVAEAISQWQTRGFINYYGLQRFGSFSITTDTIGKKMLQGDFQGACDLILNYSPVALEAAQATAAQSEGKDDPKGQISQDDMARAEAIHIWKTTKQMGKALDRLPRRFQAENAIIRHLGRVDKRTGEMQYLRDWQGALSQIARNLRLMYVHAYQSLVWNVCAAKRFEMFGSKVVEGDLVLVNEHKDKEKPPEELETVDDAGEVIIRPGADDSAATLDDKFERARALSKDEADSGKYNLYDVVLPLPGFDVIYPPNGMGDFYKDFMKSERGGGLDPKDMRRKWKDVSLSGGYRKVMSKPGNVAFEVRKYSNDNEQMVQTDLEKLLKQQKDEKTALQAGDGTVVEAEAATEQKDAQGDHVVKDDVIKEKIAVVIKMQLGSSQYATMALRELTKGGVVAFKPDFQGAR